MKLLQVADLHIGKRLMEQNLSEDQRDALAQIVTIAVEEQADALLICGDVYDKSVPSEEAVNIFDEFLNSLVQKHIPTYIISGNHDSPERLGFAGSILAESGIHIAAGYSGSLVHFELRDSLGPVNLYLLPFIKPASVSRFFDTRPETYTEAVQWVLEKEDIDPGARNVLMAHQFVTAGETAPGRSDSEQVAVGGLDNVDVSAFEKFDYVALGHIHKPQNTGRDTVQYSGSLLRYSFSEWRQQKGCIVIELGEKNQVESRFVPLHLPTEMGVITGDLQDLLNSAEPGDNRYIQAIITDTDPVYNAAAKLRSVYPNCLNILFQPKGSRQTAGRTAAQNVSQKSPDALFAELFLQQNGMEMTEEEQSIMQKVFEEVQF